MPDSLEWWVLVMKCCEKKIEKKWSLNGILVDNKIFPHTLWSNRVWVTVFGCLLHSATTIGGGETYVLIMCISEMCESTRSHNNILMYEAIHLAIDVICYHYGGYPRGHQHVYVLILGIYVHWGEKESRKFHASALITNFCSSNKLGKASQPKFK